MPRAATASLRLCHSHIRSLLETLYETVYLRLVVVKRVRHLASISLLAPGKPLVWVCLH